MTGCPTDVALLDALSRRSPPDVVDAVDRHLDECAACARRLPELTRASHVLGRPTASPEPPAVPAGAGERYRLDEDLSRSRSGRVVAAHDLQLARPVALKLLDDGATASERFAREVRVTARLQHPGVLPVYAAGVLPSGERYFAMRRVAGQTLAAAAAAAPGPAARLALLPRALAAVDAVAHAHRLGVVHGALSAERVLCGEHGETVVLDWGEAAELAAGDVADPRDDVAALGRILRATLADPGGDPTGDEVPADLVAVVAKACDDDPVRRYPSAVELADDLRAYQAGRLVAARSYTALDRARRWFARRRAAVAVAVAGLLLLAGTGAVALQRVVRERDRADEQRHAAEALVRYMLVDLPDRLSAVGRLELFAGVGRRVADYYGRLPSADAEALGAQAEALSILGHVAADRGELAAAELHQRASLALRGRSLQLAHTRAAVRRLAAGHVELGSLAVRLGRIGEAVAEYGAACDLLGPASASAGPEDDAALARCRLGLGDARFAEGDVAAALAAYEQVRALRAHLAAAAPDDAGRQGDLAEALNRVGRAEEKRGRLTEALAAHQEALAIRRRLAAAAPADLDRQRLLGVAIDHVGLAQRRLGHTADAVAAFRESRHVVERLTQLDPDNMTWRHDLLIAHVRVGQSEAEANDAVGAGASYEAARVLGETLVARDPRNLPWQRDLASVYTNAAGLAEERGDLVRAAAGYGAAHDMLERITRQDPENLGWERDLAVAHNNLCDVELARAHPAAALAHAREALAIMSRLGAADPANASWQADLAFCHYKVARALLADPGVAPFARGHLDLAIAVLRGLRADDRLEAVQLGWLSAIEALRASLLIE